MTITLRITGFHNCDGCSRKVEKTLSRIGVQLVKLDRETGTVTITTVEPSKVIRRDLERQLKKPVVVVSQDLVPANQNRNPVVPTYGPLDIQELGQAAVRLAPVLNGMEITNSNTTRINFFHREIYPRAVWPEHDGYIGGLQIRDADYEPPRPPRSPPWAATEPSAPLMPKEEQVVYGYPPEYYGISTTRSAVTASGKSRSQAIEERIGGIRRARLIEFDRDEEITGIHGMVGVTTGRFHGYTVISSLCFTTNKKNIGPYGNETGDSFLVPWDVGSFDGFYGRAGFYLDGLGCYLKATM
ncbi:hypothetical protein E3N88_13490 [Mikania micrantha]|uniref:Uncharacterized protein n=1 Tax=Mikania micrantha TaxID=192012 RepID=A0A5N6P8J3_9ASTR|nr:hypothetical protein E3N88_13490 [Mikania micrantha]